jgi:hypothetical protein
MDLKRGGQLFYLFLEQTASKLVAGHRSRQETDPFVNSASRQIFRKRASPNFGARISA